MKGVLKRLKTVVRGVRIAPELWEKLQEIADLLDTTRNELVVELLERCAKDFEKCLDKMKKE
jgi:predicted DNA-binding ribbon-helix-helix protein